MANDVRCFHSHPPLTKSRLADGERVRGVVVCVHPFGLGVHVFDASLFGHVNATAMNVPKTEGLDDYPQVGALLDLEVLGYSGASDQLRLRVFGSQGA